MTKKQQTLANKLSITFTDPFIGEKMTVKGLDNLIELFEKEAKIWEQLNNSSTQIELKNNLLHNIKSLLGICKEFKRQITQNSFQENNWNAFVEVLQKNQRVNQNTLQIPEANYFKLQISYIILSKMPSGVFLLRLVDRPNILNQAYNVLEGRNTNPITGQLMAYEFLNANSLWVQSSQTEQKRLEIVKQEWISQRDETINQIRTLQASLTDLQKSANVLQTQNDGTLEVFKQDAKEVSNKQLEQQENSFTELIKEANKKLENLESLYKDKLSLEASVTYWERKAEDHKKQRNKWLIFLGVIVSLLVIGIITILYFPPSVFNDALFDANGKLQPLALKGTILFATLLAAISYLIRLFAKLTFSASHLMEDADERKILIYTYLSLKESKSIEEDERKILMQSLFRAVDTGLLKDDSSPTLPSLDTLFKGGK